jgi:lipopolysaccharide biosynthesis protein
MNSPSVRVIASYLPQFHPIPENDEWWGKGFTEWTNVGKAKPLFRGHYQPKVPADLGYYDLRLPETRQAQADLAKEYGVEAFCYWHYWFGNGRRLLERPFNEVLTSGKPDFPFCLGWANHSWEDKQFSKEGTNRMLMEQLYPGEADYINHFNALLPAFKDKRYIRVDDKPLFMIYAPFLFNDVSNFISLWQKLAR